MNPVFIAVTRREYILVGSRPASLLADGHSDKHRIHISMRAWGYSG